jgi:uncharacterized membrane protein YiaA
MHQTPDTSFYFYLGQAVILGGIVLYLVSLWWRQRELQADWDALQAWDEDRD